MKKHLTYLGMAATCGSLLLQGCGTVGPGFSPTAGSRQYQSPDTPAAEVAADGRQAANVVLVPITPQLLAKQEAARPKELRAEVRSLLGEPEPYKIGPGDVIGITVFDHPELVSSAIPATTVADPSSVSPAPGFIVSNSGQLSFPYAGTLKVSGMTVQQLEDTITQKLTRVYKTPQVSVRVQAFRSKRAFVEGEVRLPGLQVFTDIPMTLPEAISRAGGILPTGDRSFVTLTRNGVTTPIDMMGLAEVGVDPTRIPLRNGDLITVRNREDRKVSVMGEVLRPQALPMRNGRLSLNDALNEAGGVDLGAANPGQIYVVRNEPKGAQTVYHLDARTATALALADGFALQPKDVVFVDPVSLVHWNRVVSLILPSATSANLIRGTVR